MGGMRGRRARGGQLSQKARAGGLRGSGARADAHLSSDAGQFLDQAGLSDESVLAQIDGHLMSAFVRASKPAVLPR